MQLRHLALAGRWPEVPEAFRKMKAALGIQLAEELFTGFGLRADASEEHIDVFTDGFVIRLYLASDRYAAFAHPSRPDPTLRQHIEHTK